MQLQQRTLIGTLAWCTLDGAASYETYGACQEKYGCLCNSIAKVIFTYLFIFTFSYPFAKIKILRKFLLLQFIAQNTNTHFNQTLSHAENGRDVLCTLC